MRFRQQEEFPVDGIAQVRQAPVAGFRQQCHAVGFDLAGSAGNRGRSTGRPSNRGLLGDETDPPLLQLQAQARASKTSSLAAITWASNCSRRPSTAPLFLGVVEVPVDHLMVEMLAATAYQVAVYRGAKPYAGVLILCEDMAGTTKTKRHLSPLSNQVHPVVPRVSDLTLRRVSSNIGPPFRRQCPLEAVFKASRAQFPAGTLATAPPQASRQPHPSPAGVKL